MDSKAFRDALGQFPTGVCLISVDDPRSGALALTANSFTSVSLDPPLILWSLQNESEYFREYTECEYFGISVLGAHQESLSNHYAQKAQHSIIEQQFFANDYGIPLLNSAQATFSCRKYALHPGGDHHIIVAEVVEFAVAGGEPLVFHAGGYECLAGKQGIGSG